MSEEKVPMIYSAICGVMEDIGVVGKDNYNKTQGFKYRGIDAVMNSLNPAMIKHKVFCTPEVIEQSREERTTSKGGSLIYSVCRMLEQENLHCVPCGGKTEENRLQTYFYRVYRGSHTYNTEEMSILIDGVVQEAKDQGIETATPDEIERLKSLWKGGKNGQKTKECHTE